MDEMTIPPPPIPTIVHLSFSEVRGDADLDRYLADVRRCGGVVHSTRIDTDAEKGVATLTVADYQAFHSALVATESGRYLVSFRAALPKD